MFATQVLEWARSSIGQESPLNVVNVCQVAGVEIDHFWSGCQVDVFRRREPDSFKGTASTGMQAFRGSRRRFPSPLTTEEFGPAREQSRISSCRTGTSAGANHAPTEYPWPYGRGRGRGKTASTLTVCSGGKP